MGLFDQFPYTNFHELNLDWLLRMMKELNSTIKNFVALNTIKYADPIQWNITTQYEANTVVVDPQSGTAYISSKAVPSGVALTNTDYWSVIFTLDIISANKNLTLRDDGSNVLATFASAAGDWLLWNGTLYKVSQTINVNEAYVVGYNLDRYTVEMFISDSINELVTIIGDLDDLNTTDNSNLVAAINELVTIIGDLNDLNTTDKSNLVVAINEVLEDLKDKLGHIIYEDATAPTSISDYCYSLKENTLSSATAITNTGTIDNLIINSTSNPAIYNNKKISNSSVTTSASVGVDIDQTANNVLITDSYLKSASFPMLINEHANIDSCRINNNVIEAETGDSIEINTPNNNNTQNAENVLINSNVLDVLNLSASGSGSGFGMGFAKPINNIAIGNVSKHSRIGGLHIENNADKIIVSDNIFDNCKADGAQLSVGYSASTSISNVNGMPAIITNNVFKHREDDKTSNGIVKIYDGSTDDSFGIYRNNLIIGFDIGISMHGSANVYHAIDIDGCTCVNCNVGLHIGINTKGELTLINCGKAVRIYGSNSHVDSLNISGIAGEDIFDIVASHYTFTCDKFKINKQGIFTANNMYSVLPIPTKFKGTIEIKSNFEDYLYDVDNSTITLSNSFLYGSTIFTLVENNGYYAIKPNSNYSGTVEVIIKGYYLYAA